MANVCCEHSVPEQGHCAILGGTFDPVHIGHLRLAIRLREVGFDHVVMMPNKTPPHKPEPHASAEHRLAMLRVATSQLERIHASDFELKRSGTSYTVETLLALKHTHPNTHFSWVVGWDAWQGLPSWHRALELFELANLVVVNRPCDDNTNSLWHQQQQKRACALSKLMHTSHGCISMLQSPELDISATGLRSAIAQGDNIDFLTPDGVVDYINSHQLYR